MPLEAYKVKTTNDISTTAVKCWHLVFFSIFKKTNSKEVPNLFLQTEEMWKKAILPVETFKIRKLMLRFVAEAANSLKRNFCQLKYCLLSHPRTNGVRGGGFLRA